MGNEMDQEDIDFLGNIDISGAFPILYRKDGRAQWNIAGLNYNDQCVQIQISRDQEQPRLFIQVLRRSSSGGSNGNYNWTPLAEIPYHRDDNTQRRVLRELERWLGISTSFRDWMNFNA